MHARTFKRDLVLTLFNLRLSVSYTRVLGISAEMIQMHASILHNVFCPFKHVRTVKHVRTYVCTDVRISSYIRHLKEKNYIMIEHWQLI